MASTVFARSNLPLQKWFRALLYLTNSAAGLPTSFFAGQFEISEKAAWRMASRLRQHLHMLEWATPLGGDGMPVFLGETKLAQIVREKNKPVIRIRLLTLTDGQRTRFLPLAEGRFREARATLESVIAADAGIVLRSRALAEKISNYRPIGRGRTARYSLAEDPWLEPFGIIETATLRMKRFLLHAHLRIDAQHLPGYLGHFSFLWNCRV
jgi:hypothetical protein